MEGYTRSESARQHSFFYLAGYMISYLLHRLFVDTYTVDMNGAAITITYYNEAPLTKVKPQNKIFERNFKVVKIGIANKSIRCRILAPYKIARLIIS